MVSENSGPMKWQASNDPAGALSGERNRSLVTLNLLFFNQALSSSRKCRDEGQQRNWPRNATMGRRMQKLVERKLNEV